MKTIEVVSTANRNLRQSFLRSLLTVLAIVIGAFTLTVTLAIGEGLKGYINDQTALMHVKDTLIANKGASSGLTGLGSKPTPYDPTKNDFGGQFLDAQDLDAIRLTPNVERVEPSLNISTEYVMVDNAHKFKTRTNEFLPTMQLGTAAGNISDVGKTSDGLALGYGFVEAFGFKSPQDALGKTVTFAFKNQLKEVQSHQFVVKAVLANSLIMNTQTIINRSQLKSISEWQASGAEELLYRYVTANIYLKPGLTADQVTAVQKSLSNKQINAGTYESAIDQATSWVGSLQLGLGVFSAIAILAATFGIVNTLYMAVTERTREVGLLKALGMRSGEIFSLFATEAALIGLWGSLIGFLLALLVGFGSRGALGDAFGSVFPGFTGLAFPPALIIGVILGIMALALAAGTLPALKAMRQDPITALRYE